MPEEYKGRRVASAPADKAAGQGGKRAVAGEDPELDDELLDEEEAEDDFKEDEAEEIPDEDDYDEDEDEDDEPAPKPVKKKSAPSKKAGKKPAKKSAKKKKGKNRGGLLPAAAVIVILFIMLIAVHSCGKSDSSETAETAAAQTSASDEEEEEVIQLDGIDVTAETFAFEGEVHTLKDVSDIPEDYVFEPYCTDETDPSNFIAYTNVMKNGTVLDSVSDYTADQEISFGEGKDYTEAEGIISFRGNNFRDNPTYGFAELEEYQFEELWSHSIGALAWGTHTWSGTGWTGQPLIVKWPDETKQIMNLYDWAKESDDVVEVIQATMDGTIYFYDLYTGEATRDSISIGLPFKGAGALDPRGYPIMYVGSGYDSAYGSSHAMIISLIDGSVLYTFGGSDSFALRNVYFFDSSALVDAETDTLIYPGEDGVLYLIHLNTDYDESAGTLSIDPEVTEWRYYGVRTQNTGGAKYWLGMEDSADIYDGYLFIADNGGNLMCLNLNTLELVWVQDTLDDTNGSPVLSFEDGHPYLYIGCSLHAGWRCSSSGTVNFWKIDAENGEVVWTDEFNCVTVSNVSGGIQSTPALGKYELDGYVYVTVAKIGNQGLGSLFCLDCETGEIVWQHDSTYAWSSPVCVYNSDGTGTVIYANAGGDLNMLNGLTGEVYQTLNITERVIEASPAVYDDIMVIGLREGYVRAYKLN